MDTKSPVASSPWCETVTEVSHFSFKWIIDNFSINSQRKLVSSPFETQTKNHKMDWRLGLIIDGNNTPDVTTENSTITVNLQLLSSVIDEVQVRFKFSILNSREEEVNIKGIKRFIRFKKGHLFPINEFTTLNELMKNKKELLPDDRLTLMCKTKVVEKINLIKGAENQKNYEIPKSEMQKHLELLFAEKKYCDLKLVVGYNRECTFQAHKAILSARSSVFATILVNKENAGEDDQIIELDADPEAFNEMLRFIYTDKVKNLETLASKVLVLADKYDLDRLKNMCEKAIGINLDIDSASAILAIADTYGAPTLKKNALEFILEHKDCVVETKSYLRLKEIFPNLIVEMFELQTSIPLKTKNRDFSRWNRETGDVTIILLNEEERGEIQTTELTAHEIVLTSQSSVFSRLLNDTVFTKDNELILRNIPVAGMKNALNYLYGKAVNFEVDIVETFFVATCFQIENLKVACKSALERRYTDESTVIPLMLGLIFDAEDLSENAFCRILHNEEGIFNGRRIGTFGHLKDVMKRLQRLRKSFENIHKTFGR